MGAQGVQAILLCKQARSLPPTPPPGLLGLRILDNRTIQLVVSTPQANSTKAQDSGDGDALASQPTRPDIPRGKGR